MFCLNHHRKYLWTFFFLFFSLTCVALVWDCFEAYSSGSGSSGGSSIKFAMPSFLNVVFVFAFSTVSALLQNALSNAIINPDLFKVSSSLWLSNYINVKASKKIKKVTSSSNYWSFIFASMFANLFQLIPAIVLLVLLALNLEQTLGSNLQNYFFGAALLINYASWHLSCFITWLFVFSSSPSLSLNQV